MKSLTPRLETPTVPHTIELGQWIQVLDSTKVSYCRIFPSNRLQWNSCIQRDLTESEERAVALDKGYIVRPWLAKLPNADYLFVRFDQELDSKSNSTKSAALSKNSLRRLEMLMNGYPVRKGCRIHLPCLPTLTVEEVGAFDSKSQDCIVTNKTKIQIVAVPIQKDSVKVLAAQFDALSTNDSPSLNAETYRAPNPDDVDKRELKKLHMNQNTKHIATLLYYLTNFPKSIHKLGTKPPTGLLLYGPPGVGKTSLVLSLCKTYSIPLISVNPGDILGSSTGDAEERLQIAFQKAKALCESKSTFCVLFLDEVDALAPSRDHSDSGTSIVASLLTLMDGLDSRGDIFIIGATNRPNAIDSALRRPGRFDREVELTAPDVSERQSILKELLKDVDVELEFDELSRCTNGYVQADLVNLVREVLYQKRDISNEGKVMMNDMMDALVKVKPALRRNEHSFSANESHVIHSPAKHTISRLLKSFLRPEKYKRLGLAATSGILLYGPPGCAKTSIVRSLSSSLSISFFTLSGADIYSSYLGSSEETIRDMFKLARSCVPSILFLDELDSIVSNRSFSKSESGVSERILSTLLNEMDGVEETKGVLVIGATNRPDRIDSALLRPGRFTNLVYVGAPTHSDRICILEAMGRKSGLKIDWKEVAAKCDGYTGADLRNLVREVCFKAIRGNCDVDEEDVLKSMNDAKGSVSQEMVDQYQEFFRVYGSS